VVALHPSRAEAVPWRAERRSVGPLPGLTLVELLQVVAILGVLAGLLLPALYSVRDSARRSTCTSNLRQLALAVSLYCRDYDDTFPPGGAGRIRRIEDADQLWFRRIEPFYRDSRVLHCPADTIRNAARTLCGALPEEHDRPDLPALSYGMNWDLIHAANEGRPQAKVAALLFSAQTLLLSDCTEPWAFGPVYCDAEGVRWSHIGYANGPPVAASATVLHGGRSGAGHERHGADSLIAFVDGHEGFVPAARLYNGSRLLATSGRQVGVQWPVISPEAVPPEEAF
jgi:prepilin-type N-terminal cleavage/methylation domain-containing protein